MPVVRLRGEAADLRTRAEADEGGRLEIALTVRVVDAKRAREIIDAALGR
jgi:hypothetical protein